jgi:hypothetical protein
VSIIDAAVYDRDTNAAAIIALCALGVRLSDEGPALGEGRHHPSIGEHTFHKPRGSDLSERFVVNDSGEEWEVPILSMHPEARRIVPDATAQLLDGLSALPPVPSPDLRQIGIPHHDDNARVALSLRSFEHASVRVRRCDPFVGAYRRTTGPSEAGQSEYG